MGSRTKAEKVVVITGGGGTLGGAFAGEFAAAGWTVALGVRTQNGAHEYHGGSICTIRLDVTDAALINAAIDQVVARWGRIDALINNAGTIADAPIWNVAADDFDQVLSVNLKGAFLCAKSVLRPMLRQREGHIVNVSSFSGRVGARGQTSYAAAKAGLFGLTTSLAQEVASRNIRVNAVLPGILQSRMTSHLTQEQMRAYAQANALGRINSPVEVAKFVVFLAGMQNISGQLFQLDSRIAPWS